MTIQRPVAICHHKSEPHIVVKPKDHREGITARYQRIEGNFENAAREELLNGW
jgi:hypothetical protein